MLNTQPPFFIPYQVTKPELGKALSSKSLSISHLSFLFPFWETDLRHPWGGRGVGGGAAVKFYTPSKYNQNVTEVKRSKKAIEYSFSKDHARA